MIVPISFVVSATLWNLTPLVPHPVDTHGWALRVRGHASSGPFLLGESPDWSRFEILLYNKSPNIRAHPLLHDAFHHAEMDMSKLTRPDDFWIGGVWQTERRRGDLPAYLKPGEHASTKKSLRDFGIMQMRKTGEYEVQFSLQTPQGQIVCPPWKFTVVDTPPRDVLDSHRVLLTGLEARAPANEQEWIAVEQVTLGNRIWLIYRKYYSAKNGGGIAYTFRIRELAAKVELKVEGVYGDRTPIKIQYKDAASPSGTTTLLLDSVDGRPWEDEAERLRLKHLAPAPRLKP